MEHFAQSKERWKQIQLSSVLLCAKGLALDSFRSPTYQDSQAVIIQSSLHSNSRLGRGERLRNSKSRKGVQKVQDVLEIFMATGVSLNFCAHAATSLRSTVALEGGCHKA